jgi:membrane protein DedA with SNARE-associated domain
MTIESSFIPFPSEVVVPPAAYKAAAGELNIFLVVLFSTIGACLGAIINYCLALWIGRPLVYKFAASRLGHLLLLSEAKIENAEKYFVKHGIISTLIGRLIPAVRQLISIPAGLAKMRFGIFLLFTALGAGLWNVILAVIGEEVGDLYFGHSVEGAYYGVVDIRECPAFDVAIVRSNHDVRKKADDSDVFPIGSLVEALKHKRGRMMSPEARIPAGTPFHQHQRDTQEYE